jgi:hypothetical protein
VGFGPEPESARRGREARLFAASPSGSGSLPAEAGPVGSADQRVPFHDDLAAASHQPPPSRGGRVGPAQNQPDRAAKESKHMPVRKGAEPSLNSRQGAAKDDTTEVGSVR